MTLLESSLWECRKDFTAYAEECFREFGDRVLYWTTVNEPNIFAIGGYDQGIVPPQRCSFPFGFNCSRGNSSSEPYIALHHILLSHASATRLYRKKYRVIFNFFIPCAQLSIFLMTQTIIWFSKKNLHLHQSYIKVVFALNLHVFSRCQFRPWLCKMDFNGNTHWCRASSMVI